MRTMECKFRAKLFFFLIYIFFNLAASGLSCSVRSPAVCGIQLLPQGIKPVSSALEGRFSTTEPPGKFPEVKF